MTPKINLVRAGSVEPARFFVASAGGFGLLRMMGSVLSGACIVLKCSRLLRLS